MEWSVYKKSYPQKLEVLFLNELAYKFFFKWIELRTFFP